jgi:hypothetical protein
MKRLCFSCLFLILISTIALASNAVPLIYQPLVPTSVAPGSNGFTLTINGNGFASDAVVNWNGSPRVTAVISSSTVQATITSADVAKAGTASVTVTNPAKRNRTSNVVYFPIRNKSAKVAFSIDPHLNAPGAIAVGDFNNDGKLDVAVGNGSVIDVYLGKGDGTFRKPIPSTVNISPGPGSMVAADVNNDGKLDLLVATAYPGPVYVTVMLGDGSGKLTQGNTYGPSNDTGGWMAVGDLNGDGNADFVISGQSTGGGGTGVYLGNGDGTFQLKTFTGGYGVPVLGDFNGDGNLDIATPNYQDSFVNVCFGNGDGTFQTCSGYDTGVTVSAVTAADVNGDGKLDLITDGVVVLLNKGDGTFSVGSTVQLGLAGDYNPIGAGDFNGDGLLDIAVLVGCPSESLAVLLGRGNGKFGNPIEFAVGSFAGFYGLGLGDFDGTGELGAAVADSQTSLFLQSPASMSPSSLSFGNQDVGTRSRPQTDTLTNIGSSPLSIQKIGITGADPKDFAQTNNCPASLPAGHSCRFKVTFKPTQQGARSASLSVSYKGIGSPQTVPLGGTGVSVTVTLTPSKLEFATQLIDTTSSPQTATLTNTSNQVVNISNISTSGPFQQTNNCPSTLQVGANCKIQVEFDPRTKGPATGKLSVTDDAMGSPQTVALSGTGTVVELSPVGVNFGDQKVGTKSSPIPITLTNKGKTSLSISQIAITGKNAGDFAETNNCGSSVPPQGHCKILVTFTPTAKGGRSATLKVSDDGGGSPQAVSLAGTGT